MPTTVAGRSRGVFPCKPSAVRHMTTPLGPELHCDWIPTAVAEPPNIVD